MHLIPRLALLLSSLIAAATFIVAKETTAHFNTVQLAWFRIMLSFALVFPLYRLTHRHRSKPQRRDIWRMLLLGLMGVTANQMLFLYGISLAPPLDGALLYSFTPALVLVAAVVLLGERLTLAKAGGVFLAGVGVAVVLQARGLTLSSDYLFGDMFIMLAVLAWSGYTLLGKSVLRHYDPLTVITWSFGFGALSLLPLTPWAVGTLDFSAPGWRGWLGVVYLSAMTSGVAFTLWYWALKRLEASQVAVFTNTQPVLTALLVWAFYGAIPSGQIVLGGLMVLGGVTVAQWPAKPARVLGSAADGNRPPHVFEVAATDPSAQAAAEDQQPHNER